MKTSELQGAALDWAVAKCEGTVGAYRDPHTHFGEKSSYVTDWNLAGPIIERELIDVYRDFERNEWRAENNQMPGAVSGTGSTPLIAAMRCYVQSKLGDEVDVPEELL